MKKEKIVTFSLLVLLLLTYFMNVGAWIYSSYSYYMAETAGGAALNYEVHRILHLKVIPTSERLLPIALKAEIVWLWISSRKRSLKDFLLGIGKGFGVLAGAFVFVALVELIFFSYLNVYTNLWFPIVVLFIKLFPDILIVCACVGIKKLIDKTEEKKKIT